MQQHDKSQKRRTITLVITYIIMTLAVAAISFVCIMLVLGYRLDLKNGDVEQGALLQFRSFPSGASINLDGENLSFSTPGKKNVSAGNHTISYEFPGYEKWQKSFKTHASELLWLNYARLIPQKLVTTNLKTYPQISNMLPSPDKKWLIVQHAPDSPEFTLVDVRDDKKPVFSTLTLPEVSYSPANGQPHRFELKEWDFGARYVLVKHTVGSTVEYLKIDRTSSEPQTVINISTKLGLAISDIHFSGTSGVQFYAQETANIRKLDVGVGTISQPLVKDVTSFKLFKDDVIAYVQKTSDEGQNVGMYLNNKAIRVASYDPTMPVYVDVSEYFSDYYLAVGRGTSVEVFMNPEQKDHRKRIIAVTMPVTQQWLRFASSGRFVAAGSGSQFTTYDIETKNINNINMPGSAADAKKPLQWLDDYYLVSTANDDVRITEFDGMNQHVITSSMPNLPVSLSDNGKLLYNVAKQQDGSFALQATKLTLK